MKKIVVFVLVGAIIISMLSMVSASEFPYDEFKLEYNRRTIGEKESNNDISDAMLIESGETSYGSFDLPDGSPLPDYYDIDYYKFKLYSKSHIIIYAETETGEDNAFLTIWEGENVTAASYPVQLSSGEIVHVLSATLNAGVYYFMVSEPIDDNKYNGIRYMCYFESIPAYEKIEKTPNVSNGGLSNFQKSRRYEYNFYDVTPNDWFADDVINAYELELVNGVSNTQYKPTGEITIAETIALACRLHSIYHYGSAEFNQGFTWYQVYVDYAIKHGIIQGGEFPDYTATATRAKFAGILAKALPGDVLPEINAVEYGEIPDVPGDHIYAADIYMLYRSGVLTGNDEQGTFAPETSIQRSAVAAIVTRMAIPNERQVVNLR